MRSVRILGVLGGLIVASAGCGSSGLPPYSEVRAETIDVLQQVADLIPEPKEISETPEFEPYPCDDAMILGNKPGAFFTGQWRIFVDETFDVANFVRSVPSLLGEPWQEESLDVPVSFAQVRLVRESPHMSLTVEESTPGDRRAVELLAISRCGIEDKRESTTTQRHSPRTNSSTTLASPAPISSAGRRFPFTSNE
jgi:hypothetical protein